MKSAVQLFASAFSLCVLLGATASAATNIAELPLKASVLAKPNVVFAMDDSGSMDWEVMVDGTFQGVFYANYWDAVLYPAGALRTGSVAADWMLYYLFPNGTGAGNRVYGDPAASYGTAIPPTPQMAWTRSPAFNSIYYDTMRTYQPWAPAYVSGPTAQTFGDANPSAARSHPVNGATTMALNADLSSNAADWRFTFIAGMTIPATASNVQCLFAAPPGVLPWTVDTARGLCAAQVPYYPATFWHREDCTIDNINCAAAWNGQSLRRYEIKAGNTFPSGRTFAAEMQNFANWFTYYRKRRLMLGAAMGQVLENMNGLRMGVVAFNNRVPPTMFDADATSAASNRLAVAGRFYTVEGDGGTPTNATMSYIHSQFDTNTGIIQYACQRNAQFIITDGFSNDGATAPLAYNQSTYGAAAPYQAIAANSLHDKALSAFTYRLRATTSALPAGRVPLGSQAVQNPDPNPNLHINTYALTLGMRGSLWPAAPNPFTTAPAWPAPVANTRTMIDDLWHATINGRGQMYLATTPTETAAGIQAGLLDIISNTSAQSGVAVSTVNLVRGDSRAYFGTYDPSGWKGDVKARSINPSTGVISATEVWSASNALTARAWGTRVIASQTAAGGVGFTSASVGSLVNPGDIWGNTDAVINYLRGNRTGEGTTFRSRTSLLGAILNSEPAISRADNVLYINSGEGMLHAFDISSAGAGAELWAFVPRAVLGDLGQTTQRAYSFKSQLDGSPVLATAGSRKILVSGMGAAGRSYFALDVTTPRGLSESDLAGKVMWEFPSASDTTTQAKVGQTLGQPVVVNTTTNGWVVLVTSGYNNADGIGRMWMLNATTGAVIKEFSVGVGTAAAESGLAHIAGFEEGNGTVRYVYGGDLLGNVWRFDLQNQDTPTRLAVLTGPTGTAQPVTAPPELTMIGTQRIVVVPTGRILDITDFGNNSVQSVYVFSDGATLNPARSSLVQRTFTRGSPDTLTGTAVNWTTHRGWFVDLPAGEHANTRPQVTYGGLSFVTNMNGGTDCSASSYLYLIDIGTGAQKAGADYISTTISTTSNSSRVTVLLTTDGKATRMAQDFDDDGGNGTGNAGGWRNPKKDAPPPMPAAKSAWREVRR